MVATYCYVLFSHWFDNWALNCHLPVVNLPRLNFEQSSMIHYSEDHHSLFFYLALWRLEFWLMISSRLLILRSRFFPPKSDSVYSLTLLNYFWLDRTIDYDSFEWLIFYHTLYSLNNNKIGCDFYRLIIMRSP